jgi:hypothetical protein
MEAKIIMIKLESLTISVAIQEFSNKQAGQPCRSTIADRFRDSSMDNYFL